MSASNLRRSKREHLTRKHSLGPPCVGLKKAGMVERQCESTRVSQSHVKEKVAKVHIAKTVISQVESTQSNTIGTKRLDARRYRQAFSAKFKDVKNQSGEEDCTTNQACVFPSAVDSGNVVADGIRPAKGSSATRDQATLEVESLNRDGTPEADEVTGSELCGLRQCTEAEDFARPEKSSERREFTYFSRKRKHQVDQQQRFLDDGVNSQTVIESPVKEIGSSKQVAGQDATESDGLEGRGDMENDQHKKGQIRRSGRKNIIRTRSMEDTGQNLVKEDSSVSGTKSKKIYKCKILEGSNGRSTPLGKHFLSGKDSMSVATDDDIQVGGCRIAAEELNLKQVDKIGPGVSSNHHRDTQELLEKTFRDGGVRRNRRKRILREADSSIGMEEGNLLDDPGMDLVVSVPIGDKLEMHEHRTSEHLYTGEWVQCIDCKKWQRLDCDVQVSKEAWRCNDNNCNAFHVTSSASQEETHRGLSEPCACNEPNLMNVDDHMSTFDGCVGKDASPGICQRHDGVGEGFVKTDSELDENNTSIDSGRKKLGWAEVQEGSWWPAFIIVDSEESEKTNLNSRSRLVQLIYSGDSRGKSKLIQARSFRPFWESYEEFKNFSSDKKFIAAVVKACELYQEHGSHSLKESYALPIHLESKEFGKSSHLELCGTIEGPVNSLQKDEAIGKEEMDGGDHSTVTQKSDECLLVRDRLCKEAQGFDNPRVQLKDCGAEGNDMEVKGIIQEKVTETGEDANIETASLAQIRDSVGRVPTDLYNNVCEICKGGGELLCCDGKGCRVTYHLSCLDPPLDRVPPGDWYCPTCAYKKVSCGVYSVSGGVESIWDVKEVVTERNEIEENVSSGSRERDRKAKRDLGSEHGGQPETGCSLAAAVQMDDKGLKQSSSYLLNNTGNDSLTPKVASEVSSPKVLKESKSQEKLYFVKYRGLAHIHNQWVSENQLLKEASKKLATFKKKFQKGKAPKWNPEWAEPHRLIQRRFVLPPKHLVEEQGGVIDKRMEWCVKWKGLGYDQCTWELEDGSVFPHAKELVQLYDLRCEEACQRAIPGRAHKVKKLRNSAFSRLKKVPEWMKPGMDSSHLKLINKLREFWQSHRNAILIDEINQERIATTLAFILSLIKEFEIARPILIVTSSTGMSIWESEFVQWAPSVNMVLYSGNRESREVIQQYEFYGESGCVMVQIVLSTSDIVTADLDFLKCLEWEALIIDECQRIKFSKLIEHLDQLLVDFRLLLFSEQPKDNVAELSHLLAFLERENKSMPADTSHQLLQDSSEHLAPLKAKLSEYTAYERKSDPLLSANWIEYWVPVELASVQLKQYCTILLMNMNSLCSVTKKNDSVGALRDILLSLRKCCNHPYLVDVSLQSTLTEGLPEVEFLDVGINASGKLQLLDSILSELRLEGQRVLILFQVIGRSGRTSIGDILDDHIRQRFGVDSYERVDGGLATTKKQAALQMFNSKDSGRFVFLLEKRACGASIKLSSIDTVIIFDSDWNPLSDLRALQRLHIDTQVEHLKVFRFYSPYTVEERVLISARQDSVLDSHLENLSATVCQLLLMWGATHLFEKYEKICDLNGPNLKSSSNSNNESLKSLAKEMLVLAYHGSELSDSLPNALIPRISRAGGYGKGVRLLGEAANQLIDDKVTSNVFWTKLLKGRHIEKQSVAGQLQRPRRKVQYYEGSPPKSVSDPDEGEGKRKRRRVGGTLDPISLSSWLKDARKMLASEKETSDDIMEGHAYGANQASNESVKDDSGRTSHPKGKKQHADMHSGKHPSPCSGSCDVDVEITGSDGETINGKSFREITDGGYNSSSIAAEDNFRSKERNRSFAHGVTSATFSLGKALSASGAPSDGTNPEGFASKNKETEDGNILRLAQQSLHVRIRPELAKLCKTLQLPDDVTKIAEEFLAYVVNNYRLPKEPKSLLQAVEISLCWAAAHCLKYDMDLETSLGLAKLHLNFECKREEVDSVYSKLREHCLNLRRDIPFSTGQASSRAGPSPVYSTSQQHADDLCSQDDRVSTSRNDNNNSSQMKSVQTSFKLHDLPASDDPQQVIVNLPDSAGGREEVGIEGQTGSDVLEREPLEAIATVDVHQVEKDINCHPKQGTLNYGLSQEDINVLDPMEVAGSPSDPEPQILSECQLDFLTPEKFKLMKEKIQVQKQERMQALLRKQKLEVVDFFKCSEKEKKKLQARQYMECSSIRTVYTNPEVRDAKLREQKEIHAQRSRELEEHLKKALDDLKSRQSAFREKQNRIYAALIEKINTGRMSGSHVDCHPDVIESGSVPEVLEPVMITGTRCEPCEITLPSAGETERFISGSSSEQQHEHHNGSLCESQIIASAQRPVDVQNQMVDAQRISHMNHLQENVIDSLHRGSRSQSSSQRNRPVVPYQWDSRSLSDSQQQQHPNQEVPTQQDQPAPSMGTWKQDHQASEVLNSLQNQASIPSQLPSEMYRAQTGHLENGSGCCPTSVQPLSNESSQPMQEMDMSGRSGCITEIAMVACSLPNNLQSTTSIANSMQLRTSTSSRIMQTNLPDPLYHEMLRIRKEQERIKKLHEEETARIKAQFQKELEELKRRYNGLLEEEECAFAQRKRTLETNFIKVDMNRRLAEAFKIKVHDNTAISPLTQSGSVAPMQHPRQQALPTSNARLAHFPAGAVPPGPSMNVADVSTSCILPSASGVHVGGMLSLQGNMQSNDTWAPGLQFAARRPGPCTPLQNTQFTQGAHANALPPNLAVPDMLNRNFQPPACSGSIASGGHLMQTWSLQAQGSSTQIGSITYSSDVNSFISQRLQQCEAGHLIGSPNRTLSSSGSFLSCGIPLGQTQPNLLLSSPASSLNVHHSSLATSSSDMMEMGTHCATDFVVGSLQPSFPLQGSMVACPVERTQMPQAPSSNMQDVEVSTIVESFIATDTQRSTHENVLLEDNGNIGASLVYGNNASDPPVFIRGETPCSVESPEGHEASHPSNPVPVQPNCNAGKSCKYLICILHCCHCLQATHVSQVEKKSAKIIGIFDCYQGLCKVAATFLQFRLYSVSVLREERQF